MGEGKSNPKLTEEERKSIYRGVWKIQAALSPDESDYEDKLQKAYGVIALRYEVDEDAVRQVCIEEAKKKWPPE